MYGFWHLISWARYQIGTIQANLKRFLIIFDACDDRPTINSNNDDKVKQKKKEAVSNWVLPAAIIHVWHGDYDSNYTYYID